MASHDVERCPWCNQTIPQEGAAEIRAHIAAKEREQSQVIERRIRSQLARENEQRVQTEIDKRLKAKEIELEEAKTQAVKSERAKWINQNVSLQEKLERLQRQLEKKTADEHGEGAEVDLYEALRREFPIDDITRVKRGAPGADIIHKVMDKGRACGVIVYDSKNRASWLSSYATKLKQDQRAHQAQHAILSTQAFPSGSRQLHLLDGIILANPARVSIIAQLLRSHIVQMDTLKLRNDARAGSTVRLYDYIVSDECEQWFEQIEKSVTDMEQLEIIELKAHEKVWKQRHQLIRGVQQAYTGISSAVDHIVNSIEIKPTAKHQASPTRKKPPPITTKKAPPISPLRRPPRQPWAG
ncbi:MAG TPA: DUF2130 domain-containing protein [Stellaceae bacterium]|nr:DUF2130 domain-containing protein [Stellaceae bacterium]